MADFRVIVCGGRDWSDRGAVYDALEYVAIPLCGDTRRMIVVHGGCPTGADKFADDWARVPEFKARIWPEIHAADWARHGRAAGPKRNEAMAAAGADLCLAFWDGESRGTQHMIACAVRSGIPVRIVPAKGGRK